MRAQGWFLILASLGCTSACIVSSFDVSDSVGGASSGGTHSGGKSTGGEQPSAGRAGDVSSGATTTGGTTAIGGTTTTGGTTTSAGETSIAGDASGGAPEVPYRVGFSEFHDSASGSDQASASLKDATFALPPGTQEGDLLLVFFGADHSLQNLDAPALTPLGWSIQLNQKDVGTDGQGTYLLYRFAGSSEPDPVVFKDINNPPDLADGVQGLLSVYRGISKTGTVNAFETATDTIGEKSLTKVTTPTPGITTTVDGCLLIAGLSPDSAVDAPRVETWPLGFDQNRMSVVNPPQPNPYGWANIYSAEQIQAQAGQIVSDNFVWDLRNATEYYGTLSFVLALAPAR
jgi:hypothetical protein